MHRTLGSERGEGKIGLIIALVILVTGIWTGYVLIPIKIKTYEFYDAMREEARYGAVNRKDKVVHDRLLKKAKQLDIPLDAKNLEVRRDGGMFIISAEYDIPVDLGYYRTDWEFRERATAPIF